MRVDFVYKELFSTFQLPLHSVKVCISTNVNHLQLNATNLNRPPLTLLSRLSAWQAIKMFIQSLRQGIEGLHIVALQLILSCYGDIVYT